MAMQEIAKSNEQQVDSKDLKKVDVQGLTNQEAADLSKNILSDSENINQVKVFPDLWNSLSDEQKSDFVAKLDNEIQNSIDELQKLGIEYSPEVTNGAIKQIADFNFVRENKEKIPQSWSKLEMKAKEVAHEIEEDIKKEGLDRNLNQ